MIVIAAVLAGLVPMIPAMIFALGQRRRAPVKTVRGVVLGLTAFNAVLLLVGVGIGLIQLVFPSMMAFAIGPQTQGAAEDQYASLAKAIATGLSAIGAGISVGAAAIGAGVAGGSWSCPHLRGPGRRYRYLWAHHLVHDPEWRIGVKVLVIGHPEAVLGFSLVGVHGQAVTTAAEVNQALDDAMTIPDVGIILVTEDVAELIQTRMDQLKLRSTVPLVVEIPGPEGPRPDRPSLSEVIRRAIGVKI